MKERFCITIKGALLLTGGSPACNNLLSKAPGQHREAQLPNQPMRDARENWPTER